ncbi:MAG: 2-dehydropantoate 2-reductase, partial [Treponema sp.]|nr:2-dehydropantoate 2-reductase [Treponema sp.]
MNIYIDFDDCLCETAAYFSKLAAQLFGVDVPYEKIKYFNLQKSFLLPDDKYDELMIQGHLPEALLSYEETPGAVETINSWIDKGHD